MIIGAGVTAMQAAIRSLDTAIMPRCCAFCGTECDTSEAFCCHGCFVDLPWLETRCDRCAQPVVTQLPTGLHCAQCQLKPPPFIAAAAPLIYTFPVDAAIKAMKFRRRLDYVPAFSAMLYASLTDLPHDVDALLPVPLHWRRQAMRGFNQAHELCKPLSRQSGLKIIPNVRRSRATLYQSGLHAAERRRNLRAAFTVYGAIDAQHVLIVDDVITTGETCRQLATVVLQAGACKVSVLAVARATAAHD